MEIEFSDLNKLKSQISNFEIGRVEIGTEFSIQKDLVMQGIGRIEGNNEDLFSNLMVAILP